MLKISLTYIGSSISAFGTRLIGAISRESYPHTRVNFVVPRNFRRINSILNPDGMKGLSDSDICSIAEELIEDDVIGLACMTEDAAVVKWLINRIRSLNSKAIIVWGGVHAILAPEDAIAHADAVCTNEGEKTFPKLLERLEAGKDYRNVEGFWFRDGENIIKGPFSPLLTPSDMDNLPHPLYGTEQIYQPGVGFRLIAVGDYLDFDALSYNTVWSRGCPFRCSYCANVAFMDIDRGYGKIRHSSVSHIIDEVVSAVSRNPHISFVAFHDDCFISLPEEVLREFSAAWQQSVGLPFIIHGLTPAHVRHEKIKILRTAGLTRVRMGIQSGSDRILKFYGRPNRPGLVKEAIQIVGAFAKEMIPPAYDIILDNPIETKEDVEATIRLVQEMPRPFTLNIFALRNIPNTELGRQLDELDFEIEGIEQGYTSVRPTFANMLLYLVAFARLPGPLFEWLLGFVKPYRESTQTFSPLLTLFMVLFFVRRAAQHFLFLDFSVVFGRLGYLLWKFRIVGRKRCLNP